MSPDLPLAAAADPAPAPRGAPARPRRRLLRALLAPLLLALLACGVLGGLLRAGVLPWPGLPASAALQHGALMIGGFFGCVIGLERAVALRRPWAFAAPLTALAGGFALLHGRSTAGLVLLLAASSVFVAVGVAILQRQRAAHTAALLAAALLWAAGNLRALVPGDAGSGAPLAAWFGFLVLTIAAERLEMTRLLRRQPLARPLFAAAVVLLLAAVALGPVLPALAAPLYGAALLALAAWLARFDIARITLGGHGLARYMAVALLAGYAWLAAAGLAWGLGGLQPGSAARDTALHALGLGFVFSMVMAHAPVILPALTGLKLRFGPGFYAPLALLHGGLLLRLGGGALDAAWRPLGAALNAWALALFALTVAGSVLAERRRQRPRRAA